jgi:hypothetical protein
MRATIPAEALEEVAQTHPSYDRQTYVWPIMIFLSAILALFAPVPPIARVAIMMALVVFAALLTLRIVQQDRKAVAKEKALEDLLLPTPRLVPAPAKLPRPRRKNWRSMINLGQPTREFIGGAIVEGGRATVPLAWDRGIPVQREDFEALTALVDKLITTPGVAAVSLTVLDGTVVAFLQFQDVDASRMQAIISHLAVVGLTPPASKLSAHIMSQPASPRHVCRADWDIQQIYDGDAWTGVLEYVPQQQSLASACSGFTMLGRESGVVPALRLLNLLDEPKWQAIGIMEHAEPAVLTGRMYETALDAAIRGFLLRAICGAPDLVLACVDPVREQKI